MEPYALVQHVVEDELHALDHSDAGGVRVRPEDHELPVRLEHAEQLAEHAPELLAREMLDDAEVVDAVERAVRERQLEDAGVLDLAARILSQVEIERGSRDV